MKKKYMKLGLAFLGAVATAGVLVTPVSPIVAQADALPSITGVNIDSNNILTWDAVAGAAYYFVGVNTGGKDFTERSVDLNERAKTYKLVSGNYSFSITAYDSSNNAISTKYEGNFDYVSTATKLAAPTGLKWTGNTLSWNPVLGADYYHVSIEGVTYPYTVTGTTKTIELFMVDKEYNVSVRAFPASDDDDHLASDYAAAPVLSIAPVATLSNSNVSIDAYGNITLPEIYGADIVEVNISNFGKTCYVGGDMNIMDAFTSRSKEDGNYNVKIMVRNSDKAPLTNEYTVENWAYDHTKAIPALTGTVNVTGTLKVGQTLTAELSDDTNNTGNLSYSWFWKAKNGEEHTCGVYTKTIEIIDNYVDKKLKCYIESDVETGDVVSEYTDYIQKADAKPAPTTVSKTDCKTESQNDGTLTGVTIEMEYKLSTEAEWHAVTGTTVTGLSNGTYYVRYKETDGQYASAYTTLVIKEYVDDTKYAISVTGGTANKTEVSKGVTVTVTASAAPSGYIFDAWVSSDVTFADEHSETTTFVMPAKAVEVKATYKPAPLTGSVTISGNYTYGETITGQVVGNNNTGNLSYQWYRGSTPISGATNEEYTLTADDVGRTLSLVVASDKQTGTISSGATDAIAKKDADAPTAITTTACTTAANNDGSIIGVTTAMEYKLSTGDWQAVTENPITNLVNGTYYVRYKETATTKASANATIVVNEYLAPTEYGITVVGGTSDEETAIEGATVTITANAPATGKKFAGWSTTDVTLADAEANSTTFTMPAKAVSITATYTDIEYSITFNANGGTGSMTEVKKTYNTDFALPVCTLTAPEGKQFKCWKVNDVEKQVGDILSIKSAVEVIAVWEDIPVVNYSVIFDADTGTGSMTPVDANGSYTLPACTLTAPEGKKFKCWKVNDVEYLAGANITITANTTVTAVWEDMDPTPVTPDVPETPTTTTTETPTTTTTETPTTTTTETPTTTTKEETPTTTTKEETPTTTATSENPVTTTENKNETPSDNKEKKGLSGGAIAGIVIASIVTLGIAAYFALGFTLYKQGKLTGKFFETIYKWIKK